MNAIGFPLPHTLWQGGITLTGVYEIWDNGRTVGKATVEKHGLYYRISCRCTLTGAVMHRIVASCGEKRVDLGVCIPMAGQFGLNIQIPCKRIGEGELCFHLLPKHDSLSGQFVEVYPEEPFAYLSRLKGAFLTQQMGKLGIVIRK